MAIRDLDMQGFLVDAFEHAAKFSWAESARVLKGIYEEATNPKDSL